MKRIARKKKMYVRWVARKKFNKAIVKFLHDYADKIIVPKPTLYKHVIFDLDDNGKVVIKHTLGD